MRSAPKISAWVVAAAFIAIPCVESQTPKPEDSTQSDVLLKGHIVDHNIQEAIAEHVADNPEFTPAKQFPEDKQTLPKMLFLKGGGFIFDWTPGQEARYLMEDLRQGLHALQSVEKPTGFDIVALTGARQYWPKLRDISCHENPGIRYYDLDGFEEFCPTDSKAEK
jgi:hypothetical protein